MLFIGIATFACAGSWIVVFIDGLIFRSIPLSLAIIAIVSVCFVYVFYSFYISSEFEFYKQLFELADTFLAYRNHLDKENDTVTVTTEDLLKLEKVEDSQFSHKALWVVKNKSSVALDDLDIDIDSYLKPNDE